MQRLARRILYVVAIIATLYHIYLVFHPYTPISYLYRIGIFDLEQLQRATHVMFILLVGYLYSIIHKPTIGRIRLGVAYVSAALTLIPTILLIQYLGWQPIYSMLLLLVWFAAMLSLIIPGFEGYRRYLDRLLWI